VLVGFFSDGVPTLRCCFRPSVFIFFAPCVRTSADDATIVETHTCLRLSDSQTTRRPPRFFLSQTGIELSSTLTPYLESGTGNIFERATTLQLPALYPVLLRYVLQNRHNLRFIPTCTLCSIYTRFLSMTIFYGLSRR
jgi:hypothetical protein